MRALFVYFYVIRTNICPANGSNLCRCKKAKIASDDSGHCMQPYIMTKEGYKTKKRMHFW